MNRNDGPSSTRFWYNRYTVARLIKSQKLFINTKERRAFAVRDRRDTQTVPGMAEVEVKKNETLANDQIHNVSLNAWQSHYGQTKLLKCQCAVKEPPLHSNVVYPIDVVWNIDFLSIVWLLKTILNARI